MEFRNDSEIPSQTQCACHINTLQSCDMIWIIFSRLNSLKFSGRLLPTISSLSSCCRLKLFLVVVFTAFNVEKARSISDEVAAIISITRMSDTTRVLRPILHQKHLKQVRLLVKHLQARSGTIRLVFASGVVEWLGALRGRYFVAELRGKRRQNPTPRDPLLCYPQWQHGDRKNNTLTRAASEKIFDSCFFKIWSPPFIFQVLAGGGETAVCSKFGFPPPICLGLRGKFHPNLRSHRKLCMWGHVV